MQQARALLLAGALLCACGETPTPPEETVALPQHPNTPEGMVYIPGGTYTRGQQVAPPNGDPYPEELPAHQVTIDGFFLDRTEVTNRQFAAFVEATGYKTVAERGWKAEDFPNAPPSHLQPGAMIFIEDTRQKDPKHGTVGRFSHVPGASWRRPYWENSSYKDYLDHPVTCIVHEDAAAYAKWAGKRLPTEAEWERAARGGVEGQLFPWGNKNIVGGKWMANVFQGNFPSNNTALDGHTKTAPVGSFPANRYGLYDMAGNVWELCSDYYSPSIYRELTAPVSAPTGPTDGLDVLRVQSWLDDRSYPLSAPPVHPQAVLRVTRGGSYLCHASYCMRYRNAARHYSEPLAPSNHIGFRCAQDLPAE